MPIRDISNVTLPPVPQESWQNWARTESATAEVYRPRSIAELVATVVQAESRRRRVRAMGSRWAFDDCARPDHVSVELSRIPGTLLTAGFLDMNWRSKLRDPDHSIVVALAGAPLWRINEELWRLGYSMLTLGGSQGQTLAGAMSTGTHGSDLDIGGVADGIHAIHLVGAGGQEYWIECADGVTRPEVMWNYTFWDDAIVQVRNDDVFSSSLVAVGRFGIVFAVLLEVAPKYRIRESQTNSSWIHFSTRLLNLQLTGDLQRLDEDREIRDIKINLDPYAAGHGGFGSLIRRWKPIDAGSPTVPVQASSKGPDALAREVGASIAYANTLVIVPGGTEIFAATAREFFKSQQPPRQVFDRNYFVTSGVPTAGMDYVQHYEAFDQHGPFVNSMEYFFDGRTDDATRFVNAVYEQWRGFLAGYIAVRFSTRTRALLGPEQFAATVIVEVTILQGFKDTEGVRQAVKQLANESGAIPHWGQEHLLTAPLVQALYGARASTWRRALRVVTATGNAETFSSRHSLRLGLEIDPALTLQRRDRLRAWFDVRSGLHALGFSELGLPRLPGGIWINATSGPGFFVNDDGTVHAPRSPGGTVQPGSLVVRKSNRTIAEFRVNGSLGVTARTILPGWVR